MSDTSTHWCHGKQTFSSKAKALKFLAMRRKRVRNTHHCHKEHRRDVARLDAYQCNHCHQWHVGCHHRGGKAPYKEGAR